MKNARYAVYFLRNSKAAWIILPFILTVVSVTGFWPAIFIWILLIRKLSLGFVLGVLLGILATLPLINPPACIEEQFSGEEFYLSEIIRVEGNKTYLRSFSKYGEGYMQLGGRILQTGVHLEAGGTIQCLDREETFDRYLADRGFSFKIIINRSKVLSVDLHHALVNKIRSEVAEIARNSKAPELFISFVLGTNFTTLPDELDQSIKNLALSHLFSVSGFHVGIIVDIVDTSATSVSKKNLHFLLLLFAGSFLLCIGPSNVSTLRAVILVVVRILAERTGRRIPKNWDLVIAGAIILSFYPNAWKLLSFQLSFGAVLGIRLFSKRLTLSFLPKLLAGSIAVGLSANIFGIIILLTSGVQLASLQGILISMLMIIPLAVVQTASYVLVVIKMFTNRLPPLAEVLIDIIVRETSRVLETTGSFIGEGGSNSIVTMCLLSTIVLFVWRFGVHSRNEKLY